MFHLLLGKKPETEAHEKNPVQAAGFSGFVRDDDVSLVRAKIRGPGMGPFFEMTAHDFVIICK